MSNTDDPEDYIARPIGDLFVTGANKYSDDYRNQVFQIWYNRGKLPIPLLMELIPVPETNFGKKPSRQTLEKWIHTDFQERSKALDAGVRETMDVALIATKVEMLQKHMKTAAHMQDLAIEYLDAHKDELSTAAAVRLLVEGVRIERESVGIPGMLDRMAKKTDEQLLEEVRQLIQESPVDFEKIEDEIIESEDE